MNSTIVIILITIALLVLALIAFLIIRRRRYVRALRGRGWTFESRPALESVLDHHAPPFGQGFVREVDEAISGATAASRSGCSSTRVRTSAKPTEEPQRQRFHGGTGSLKKSLRPSRSCCPVPLHLGQTWCA